MLCGIQRYFRGKILVDLDVPLSFPYCKLSVTQRLSCTIYNGMEIITERNDAIGRLSVKP